MSKRYYKALLISEDGLDFVTDARGCTSVDEVEHAISNFGSRWVFYPYAYVILDHGEYTSVRQRVVQSSYPGDVLSPYAKGPTIKRVMREIQESYEEDREYYANVWCKECDRC